MPGPASLQRVLVRENVPLAPLTTLGLGGPAGRLVSAYGSEELVSVVRSADQLSQPLLVLGGGSNLVVADEGFRGTVVRVGTHGLSVRRDGDDVLVDASAGESWEHLVARCVEEDLAGVECLAGIPGLVGATPVQNVGAYGQELAQVVEVVRAYDRRAGECRTLSPKECAFGYRTSAFKAEPGRYVVLSVVLRLATGPESGPVRYSELARLLGVELGRRAPLTEVRDAVIRLRRAKGMVLDPEDTDTRSAGSFFTNPLLDVEAAAVLRERLRAVGTPGPPEYADASGRVKVSAAWLIEQAGYRPGYGAGPVGISGKHSLALVHRGGGTTGQLLELAREVREGVRSRFGVLLEAEPVLVGQAL